MPRVTHVKSARKANPRYGIEVGDSYYHWAFMVGGRGGPKICSKTAPTRSQLTQSDFMGQAYSLADDAFPGCQDADALRGLAEEVRTLGEEQTEKFDNMPEGLQQGDSGQLLEERAGECEDWAAAIEEAADQLEADVAEIEGKTAEDFEDLDDGASDEDVEKARAEEMEEALQAALDDAGSACPF
jgi:hypothetical protein